MFCHHCGKELGKDDLFCGSCGTRRKGNNCIESCSEQQLITTYFQRGIPYEEIIYILKKQHSITMSLRTFKRRLQSYGLSKSDYSKFNQANNLIHSELQKSGPSSQIGYRSMWNKLRTTYGLNIPRDAVMNILRELDPDGCKKRKCRRLERRVYRSDGPNSTWHTDGYDKLKPYGFPIHGCVDGFSRKILWLRVVRSNNASAVPASLFIQTIQTLGYRPKSVRTDCGSENAKLAALQCALADNLESHSYGSSHSNQRIENFWSHFRRGYSNWVINFFKEMVSTGRLKLGHHVYTECLWFVFSKFLQQELDTMSEEWNNHQIRASEFAQVSGIPNQLFNFPEINGFENQGIEVDREDISQLLEEVDIHKEAQEALNLDDNDLQAYFSHVITEENLLYPPKSWQNALDIFSVIIERCEC